MRLPIDPRILPDTERLHQRLTDLHRDIAQQVNGLSEGKVAAHYSARTSVPTTGTHAQGDFIRNSTPTELGSGGSKYVILGWVCVAGGTPGTWVQARALTGN